MRSLILAIAFLLAAPLYAQVGGITTPPLNNDEVGTNQAPNGGSFNGCASFTACGWATNPSCASIDTTTSYTGSDYSAKFLDCGSGNVTTLEFSNVAPGGYRQFIFTAYFKTDSAFNGAGIGMSTFDETHGGGAGPGGLTRQTGPLETISNEPISEITANSGWEQYSFEFSIDFAHVNDTHIQVRLQISGQTAGTLWMANPTIAPTWRGVSTFLIYPNYKGFLWSDLTPPERYSPGVSPVAGQIDGVTYVLPPQGDTLTGVTLTVKMATVGGCGSGVLATDTFSAPTGTQFWQFTPSQYGTLTAGTAYFLCTAVSGTYTDADSDWEIISEGSSFRTGLYNWVDPNGTIIHNGSAWFNLGSYDRYSGGRCSGVPTSYATILSSCAGNNPMTSILPQATGAPGGTTGYIFSTKQASSLASDFPSQGLDSIIDFSQYSAVNPTYPSAPPGDELTARLEAANNFGWVHHQDWSYFYGCLTTATTTCTAPTFSPTVTTGTGTITSNYLFLEWVAAAGAGPQGNSPTQFPHLTLPSSPITVNLSSAICAGSNCSVTFTTPACYSTRQVGGLLYGAEGSTSTPPANTSFSRMFPTWTSTFPLTLGSSDYIPCNTSVTLSSFDTNAIAPPTTDGTSGGQPNWRSTATDTTINQDFAAVMCSTSYPGGVGGYYIGDEFSYAAMPTIFYESQLINSNCSGNPTIGLDIGAGLTQYVCRIFDWCGSDPYGPLNAASPEEYAAAVTIPRNDSNFYSTGNTVVSTYDYPSRVDLYTEGVARDMYGSRPCWIVVRQYGITNVYGFNYQAMGSQMWKAILGCQNWGDLGAGVMTWGEVDSTGLETSVYEYDNPQAYYDFQKIANEIKNLEPVLLTPVLDSSELSAGTGSVVGSSGWQLTSPSIISNVQIAAVGGGTTTLAAVCNIAGSGSYTSVWNNTSAYPMGPVRVVTHAYGLANTNLTDNYIFTTNLCDGTFQVTFGLPSVPAATEVLVKSNSTGTPYTLAISTSGCPNSQAACFTDTWTNNNDWHVYEIQAQRGVVIH